MTRPQPSTTVTAGTFKPVLGVSFISRRIQWFRLLQILGSLDVQKSATQLLGLPDWNKLPNQNEVRLREVGNVCSRKNSPGPNPQFDFCFRMAQSRWVSVLRSDTDVRAFCSYKFYLKRLPGS